MPAKRAAHVQLECHSAVSALAGPVGVLLLFLAAELSAVELLTFGYPTGGAHDASLEIVRLEGPNRAVVVELPFPYWLDWDLTAAWHPEGEEVVVAFGFWAHVLDEFRGLFVISLASGQVSKLADIDAVVSQPAFSPDGRRLALVTDASELVVFDLGTGAVQPFTDAPGRPVNWPCWSPDGEQIAVARGDSLLFLNAETGVLVEGVPAAAGDPRALAYSPSGRYIAYAARTELYLLDRSRLTTRLLASTPRRFGVDPFLWLAWAAEEDWIVYTDTLKFWPEPPPCPADWDCMPITVYSIFSLHAVSLDGSRQVTLVQDGAYSYFAPRWISGRPTAIRPSSWGQIKLRSRLGGD